MNEFVRPLAGPKRDLPFYLIIGDGKVARHFAHYFTLAGITYQKWSRKTDSSASLSEKIQEATHVLLLISDRSIESFYDEQEELQAKRVLHFSGSLFSERIAGAHPLMTFSDRLFEIEVYRQIPFIIDRKPVDSGIDHHASDDFLPGLTNPFYFILPEHKALYHALCALSGNFTTILWEKVMAEFSGRLQIPKEALHPYLEQVAMNLVYAQAGQSVLTGPLSRGETAVIESHLKELSGDSFEGVYRAFVKAYSDAAHRPASKFELGGSLS